MNLEELDVVLGGRSILNPREYNSLALAHIGDAVFEVLVRLTVLTDGNAPVNKLHKKARAICQCKGAGRNVLSDSGYPDRGEADVFRRGRNAKSFTVPKNADLMDYRHATGLEALFGYLYLKGEKERVVELFKLGMAEKLEK